ncbi:glycosyltransferase involved in cell wall biosynthesis [Endobacter medicaginis]|uniref:Glycosyltransferase involved in cell wall biosynthesis n=4 Tax=Endobacter medicaginis TaxID=1181271 RepID=A0A839V5W0_9PROT|nr:class I SAM-dependent methyltransferase [Endobacter medicaginis]MBB3174942.1 glycosyltransferase involved in cell wall biosynthesis [Endobacter medicaginis]MCX5476397.1 class I SAM-dependent methyltransferase [Endobacter medicaginis]
MTQTNPTLDLLADPALDAPFRVPPRLDVDSAWYGHVPFAQWLVGAIAPGLIVELGTHAGVSYAAMCDSVLRAGLPTKCIAVDTWKGDKHAGFYPEAIHDDLRAFHDARYGDFSTMMRCRFDEALPYIADGSIDLLHVDGRHHYEDVREDYTSWIPKLSPRAVVLFHDTQVRERDFGVWRFWGELSQTRPSFEFLHAHGLGVFAHGAEIPGPVARLCAADAHRTATLRARFARLGERWVAGETLRHTQALLHHEQQVRAQTEARARALDVALAGAQSAAGLAEQALREHQASHQQQQHQWHDRLRGAEHASELQLAEARAALARAQHAETRLHEILGDPRATAWGRALVERAELAERHAANLVAALEAARTDRAIILGSTSWRITAPLRALRGGTHITPIPVLDTPVAPIEPPSAPVAPPEPIATPGVEAVPAPRPAPTRILFVSGEAHTPGHTYRCIRLAEATRRLGLPAHFVSIEGVTPADLDSCRLVILWRVQRSEHVENLCRLAREQGASIAFDIDDLMVVPDFATPELIDGIRTTNSITSQVRDLFVRIRQSVDLADFCLCTTEELAYWLRGEGQDTYVVPNTFDDATFFAARRAAASRPDDGLLRIGYAGGTRTHQKDFARAAPALARFLGGRDDARLVAFRDPASGEGLLLADEFADLPADRIEWRDMVPLAELPAEMARFDINIVPLETGNVFAEAKSELKYFEAALAGVPTIASPTGPFARAIRPGITGLLAGDDAAWLDHLTLLADDAGLRARIGHAAALDALSAWGPNRAASALRDMLASRASPADAARTFQLTLLRRALPKAPLPTLPEFDTLFRHDRIAEADAQVTIIIPLHNYEAHILDALESARHQTLAALDLIVIDDASTDGSAALAETWLAAHHARFRRAILLRNRANAHLGPTRNLGFDQAETPYVLPLDADNRLRPAACERLLAAIAPTDAAFVHPLIQTFGERSEVLGRHPYTPNRLVGANTIDAMALIARAAWAEAGGYDDVQYGWEDYDLWCRFAERGLAGLHLADILADYRTHPNSMIHADTEQPDQRRALIADMESRHPWLRLTGRR